MGVRGPIPESREAREAKGNPQNRPLPAARVEVEDEPLPDSPPSILGADGKAEWKRIKPSLVNAGRWKSRFFQVLVQYCLAYEDLATIRKVIRKEGLVTGKGDEAELHPAFKVQKDATERMTEGIKHLGLSPMQELRIGPAAPEKPSGYDGFRRVK